MASGSSLLKISATCLVINPGRMREALKAWKEEQTLRYAQHGEGPG